MKNKRIMRTYVKDIHKIATRVALSVAIAATGWAAAPQAIAQEVAAPAATVDEARIFAEDGIHHSNSRFVWRFGSDELQRTNYLCNKANQ